MFGRATIRLGIGPHSSWFENWLRKSILSQAVRVRFGFGQSDSWIRSLRFVVAQNWVRVRSFVSDSVRNIEVFSKFRNPLNIQ